MDQYWNQVSWTADLVHLYNLDASSAVVGEIVAFVVGMNFGLYCLIKFK